MTDPRAAAGAAAAGAGAATVNVDDDALIARKLQAVDRLTSSFGFDQDVAEHAVDFYIASRTDADAWLSSSSSGDGTVPMIDVTACYNYILDASLGQDQGGPVTPIDNCPHVSKHCCITVNQLPLQPATAPCTHDFAVAVGTGTSSSKAAVFMGGLKSDTADDGVTCGGTENWLCLECGVVRCSRYCNGHAHLHWEETTTAMTTTITTETAAAARQETTTMQTHDDDDANQHHNPHGHCIAASLSDLSVWCHVCNAYLSTGTGATGQTLKPFVERLEALKFGPNASTTATDGTSTARSSSNSNDNDNTSMFSPPPPQEPERKKIKSGNKYDDGGAEDMAVERNESGE